MGKNIVIFSDGTGQAGGVRPDQRLSNVYKLYRASRSGPDSPIDPAAQIAFYDAGLGTEDDAAGAPTRFVRWIRKLLGSVTGRGITRNIVDCYQHVLDHYEPGDRIFIFGFSRGAYTARCIANLLELCGVPAKGRDDRPLPRLKPEVREIAEEAVRTVYEHGAGRSVAKFDAERNELARRFRDKYASGDADGSNVHPHFVGVFDTVASLGARGLVRFGLGVGLVLGLAAAASFVGLVARVGFGLSFWAVTAIVTGGALIAFAASSLRSTVHVIRDFPNKGDRRRHIAKWEMKNYDQRLPHGIRFARHAMAIDETRADFPRVKWGWKGRKDERIEGEPERFVQLWFAGNHSDIGGSYPEEESRLSDISLQWMVKEATSIPDPLIVDDARLKLYPSAAGVQHCEVDAMRDRLAAWMPRWLARRWKPTWKEAPRTEVLGATMHSSVDERFALPGVWKCGRYGPYRPETLRNDPHYSAFWREAK
ncbi:DUF2235 domain-containing protein [Sphingomonas sp. BK580]|uniref:DUF2235 domain-containing protein n=1 Tax=Sphingomonas sp. BK580 TaxID=2586972 RepID=UPI00160A25C9|nr:DUF2235 domain-containing protein [Sphingomonas sp. BK580]MBB3693584.1 uncharacterized protein (DUF2235 family) [Sphingomonas sp. BK580]